MISATNILVPQILGPGLTLGVGPGVVRTSSGSVTYAEGNVALTANSTNYIFLSGSTGLLQTNLTGFPFGCYPLAAVTTGLTGILSLTDSRPDIAVGAASTGGLVVVPSSATPAFDGSQGVIFDFTLAANAAATAKNLTSGTVYQFLIRQNGAGNWTLAWPSGFQNGMAVGSAASSVSKQSFLYDGTSAYGDVGTIYP